MFRHDVFNTVRTEGTATRIGEKVVGRLSIAFAQPGFQSSLSLLRQRRAPLLTALSPATNVSPCTEDDVLAAEADQLGDTQAGVHRKHEKGMVATSAPSVAVGRVEESFDFRTGQEIHGRAIVTFGGNGQDSLDKGAMAWLLKGNVPEERVNRGETDVAGASAVPAFLLQVVEESANKGCIYIMQREIGGRLLQPLPGELKEQPKSVTV